MKVALLCLLVLVAVVYVSARPEKSTYTNKFDGVDVDQILRSDRLLGNYYKCLMNEGRCTPEGSELKRLLPDALATECSKCTEKQQEVTKKVVKYLVDNKPEMWKKLSAKYDPEGVYRSKFGEEAKKHGIKV
ncbi:PREDICTED: ejaculatory bulb-specific protein 3-like [Dufourea novaeangliae]|uniref:Ejaculatory bulb-specific protein 3 n=1 Tax=Dufourea novaeangliae TaxID=178035 RepID=A0A154P480_DUFNO|nr:PREDICTED: ejaculatory bulb-specific protein 3-like [Dufourea novaeangliae]KZC06681.1 Ejaculatory bulb-specific protein 3 [Dufourea novaeangliae]